MKVFIVLATSNNGEQFEDYREFTDISGVFSTKELAEKHIENSPKTCPSNYEPVYTEDPETGQQYQDSDEDGNLLWEACGVSTISYNIYEDELITT